jgi:hypothetical protein
VKIQHSHSPFLTLLSDCEDSRFCQEITVNVYVQTCIHIPVCMYIPVLVPIASRQMSGPATVSTYRMHTPSRVENPSVKMV